MGSPVQRGVDARLSINQRSVPSLSVPALIEACTRHGYRNIGLWREPVAATGPGEVARLVERAELRVTSLCRGGWFLAPDASARRAREDDNRRAVDEAAAIGADCLALVCGPALTKDLAAARREVADAIATLAEYAREVGVPLALEPMHPLYCGDRSVVVTLAQATAIAQGAGPGVGVLLDSYHLWWDPDLEAALADAAGLVHGLQLADWLAPPPHHLNGRGMLGEGTIDLRRFCQLVEELTAYRGPIEVEIFNEELWATDAEEALARIATSFASEVG
ncbi:MAG: sugar phosphate isomerase/epimerase [Actinomycetota bacterium]|nr:sugar phosphate isomerase/epimerase [Actinomycetota bacterium]